MPKQKLFEEESEEEVSFKFENEYAKKYDKWREKEELHKLEQKYGSKALTSDASVSSDSEDDSDQPPEVSEEMETQFLKTLALLKTKDPRIYDPDFKCFNDKVEKEKGEERPKTTTLTFEDSDEDDAEDDGNIFKIEKKAEIGNTEPHEESTMKHTKDPKIKDFLIGKADHIDDDIEKDLAPLKELWSDPKLNEGEVFLRDYILNKRYLEDGDAGEAEDKLRDDEDLEADEKLVEEQGKFERAYNFRFEEPDEEYLKRFPRTMNYVRPKDERRARKRAEVRARKEGDKRRKMEEIARLKALKLKEIQEKIAKIKEVTGNEELAFKDEDIEGDFDPEEHDRRMKALFDEQYYGDVDEEKPVFPDLDEELEIENWENYENEGVGDGGNDAEGPHCEDEGFNMDAEYDPKQARANLLEELKQNMVKKRRNRKKKSKLAELLSTEKPKFVPAVAEKKYSDYMEEYYKMDCEDIIGGDLPTRFKYREVVPNDYGLTVEEILLADDKELTQWVPLKKLVKYRPVDVEKGDVKTYAKKAADVNLKKKVLPSLFKDLPEEPEIVVPIEEATKKKKKKKKKQKGKDTSEGNPEENEQSKDNVINEEVSNNMNAIEVSEGTNDKPKKKKKKHKDNIADEYSIEDNIKNNSADVNNVQNNLEDNNAEINNIKKKKKNKAKVEDLTLIQNEITPECSFSNGVVTEKPDNHQQDVKRRKKKEAKFIVEDAHQEVPSQSSDNPVTTDDNGKKRELKRKLEINDNKQTVKKRKKHKKNKNNANNVQKKDFKRKKLSNDSANPLAKLSDERLKAYGLNPKKYKKFMKYKKF